MMRAKTDSDTLEAIETKIAYLERASIELSDVVFRQEKEIQSLAMQLRAVLERLQTTSPDETAGTLEDERPPHY